MTNRIRTGAPRLPASATPPHAEQAPRNVLAKPARNRATDAFETKPQTARPKITPTLHKHFRNGDQRLAGADPGVIRVGNVDYMVSTGNGFPRYRSTDLVHWKPDGSLFAKGHHPTWAKRDFWAPEIHQVGDHYVAYYTARDAQGMLRIGCATSKTPDGQFHDIGHPLISNRGVGLIDPTMFQDANGKKYVYWKEDSNAFNPPKLTHIRVSQLSADGTRLVGKSREVLVNQPHGWEGHVVEAPEIVKHGGYYYMLYSGNAYDTSKYAMGVARSRSPMGPFHKHDGPILTSSRAWKGPGHGSIVDDTQGQTWFVYHAWKAGHVGGHNQRQIMLDRITWKNGWPQIAHGHPTDGEQALP